MHSRLDPFAFLAIALLAMSLGCGTTYTRRSLHEDDNLSVVLRAEQKGDARVERHFRHPATISNSRLAHILSRIDVRTAVDD
ncbi:MAG: hypothetical protein GY946_16025, partial [bacterium]|nr:hypothetical protein [bacterium]